VGLEISKARDKSLLASFRLQSFIMDNTVVKIVRFVAIATDELAALYLAHTIMIKFVRIGMVEVRAGKTTVEFNNITENKNSTRERKDCL
jgi:hypothetical protein